MYSQIKENLEIRVENDFQGFEIYAFCVFLFLFFGREKRNKPCRTYISIVYHDERIVWMRGRDEDDTHCYPSVQTKRK